MSDWIEGLNHVSGVWFDVVSGVVLQSLFVCAIAFLAAKLLRQFSASLRFWIWQAAALKLLLIPLSLIVVVPFWPAKESREVVTSLAKMPTSIEVDLTESLVVDSLQPIAYEPVQRKLPSLSAISCLFSGWLLICCIQVLRCFRRRQYLSQFLKTCMPASQEHQLRLQKLTRKLQLKETVHLVRGDIRVPLVTGIWSPTIILPSQRAFERSTFDQVVLHELSHVKRRDLLWVWLPEVLRMLFFFHPLTHWIQQQAKLNSEMACDELVLSAGPSRRAYANTLLELASATPLIS